MSWDIEITDAAKDDLRDIFTYISSEFHAPDDARRIVRNILAEIQSLDEMPERFRPYPREPIASRGVRVMDVGNFCVYYLPKDGVVMVVRILYFRRDADAVLRSAAGTERARTISNSPKQREGQSNCPCTIFRFET